VVGFGALNMDHLYTVPELIRDGGVEVTMFTAQPGGSAANTIYGLAKLGLRCGFVGIVGDDEAGSALLESFCQAGVDTSGILAASGVRTGQTICITAGQGQKAIYIIPSANSLLDSQDIDLSYLSDTRYVHISSFVGDGPFSQQLQAVERLPARVKVSLALDSLYSRRGLRNMSTVLGRCAVLLGNAEEFRELTGQEPRSAAQTCLNAGCNVVVATFGSGRQADHGQSPLGTQEATASMIVTRRTTGEGAIYHTVPAVKVHQGPIVDTTGAGDAFAAGFLFGLLARRYGPAKCGALGHTAAGFSLTALGAREGLPTREALLGRFEASFRSVFGRKRKTGPALHPVRTR